MGATAAVDTARLDASFTARCSFDDTFGLALLPLSALRFLDQAIDDPGLANVIDQHVKAMGTINLPAMSTDVMDAAGRAAG